MFNYIFCAFFSASPSISNPDSPVSQENSHIPVRPARSNSASHPKTKHQNFSSLKAKLSFRKGHANEEKTMEEIDHTLGKENCSRCSFVCNIFTYFTI